MKVTSIKQPTRLLDYETNSGGKKFYSTGPRCNTKVRGRLTAGIQGLVDIFKGAGKAN